MRLRHDRGLGALVVAVLTFFAGLSSALADGLVKPEDMPGPLREVRFDQRLGEKLPLDARFRDETGREVELGTFFGDRPVVLAFVYYGCPMLCSLVLNGLGKTTGVLEFAAGRDYDVVVISFVPEETPAMAREAEATLRQRHQRSEIAAGWHFLTGSAEAIRRTAEAAGFHYAYVPESQEYAHASGFLIVAPDGTIAQYFYGIEYSPKDMRLALVEASSYRIGSLVDQVLLYCFRYDPQLGKYTAAITRILRLAGVVFCVGLGLFIWIQWRRERAESRRHSTPRLGAASR